MRWSICWNSADLRSTRFTAISCEAPIRLEPNRSGWLAKWAELGKFRVPLVLNRLDRTLSRLYLGRLLSSLHSWSGGRVVSGMGSECVH